MPARPSARQSSRSVVVERIPGLELRDRLTGWVPGRDEGACSNSGSASASWCSRGWRRSPSRSPRSWCYSYAVDPYDPDAIIPNPARRRLERSLKIARVSEGQALRKLKRLPKDHKHRPRLEQDAADARDLQEKLEALRPETPNRAPVAEARAR